MLLKASRYPVISFVGADVRYGLRRSPHRAKEIHLFTIGIRQVIMDSLSAFDLFQGEMSSQLVFHYILRLGISFFMHASPSLVKKMAHAQQVKRIVGDPFIRPTNFAVFRQLIKHAQQLIEILSEPAARAGYLGITHFRECFTTGLVQDATPPLAKCVEVFNYLQMPTKRRPDQNEY